MRNVTLTPVHVPSDHHPEVDELAELYGISGQTIAARLALIRFDHEVREWMDKVGRETVEATFG